MSTTNRVVLKTSFKTLNKVFNVIDTSVRPVTTKTLVKRTGFSRGTVINALSTLVDTNSVVSETVRTGRVGRPQITYTVSN
jgi:response regulator of citrate/malate metabolism